MADYSKIIKERFGPIPKESGLTRKMRVHQGWWRMNVLDEEPGPHPITTDQKVCNVISQGKETGRNFLTPNSFRAAKETVENRTKENSGIIEEVRLYNNLLSSQPLSFNFFGELFSDEIFGLAVLKTFYSDLTKLNRVRFEYSPEENYTNDSSAFDIAFEVEAGDKKGLIGWECKYTDTFSFKPSKSDTFYGEEGNKNYATYFDIYSRSNAKFIKPYEDYVKSKDFNQLFRNQLIAESILLNNKFDFVRTGLFYYQDDESAKAISDEFKSMLTEKDSFKAITYKNYIENIQRLDLTWDQREWTMLLWARYCGLQLSRHTTTKLEY